MRMHDEEYEERGGRRSEREGRRKGSRIMPHSLTMIQLRV
jgi:hypothetical protein